TIDSRLAEIYLGRLQGMTVQEAAPLFPDGDWRYERYGGESMEALYGRLSAFAEERLPQPGTTLLVMHGMSLRMLRAALLKLDPQDARIVAPPSCCYCQADFHQGVWRFSSFGDVLHRAPGFGAWYAAAKEQRSGFPEGTLETPFATLAMAMAAQPNRLTHDPAGGFFMTARKAGLCIRCSTLPMHWIPSRIRRWATGGFGNCERNARQNPCPPRSAARFWNVSGRERRPMTRKLYESPDSPLAFTALVVSCVPEGAGFSIALDQTAFFPESGGQGADQGTIQGVPVSHVRMEQDVIWHRTELPLEPGTQVTGVVDAARRLDQSQQHSGEHVLSGLTHRLHGLDNVGFHIGSDVVTLDFNGELSAAQWQSLEAGANRVVWANLPLRAWFPDPEVLQTLEYRSKKALTGPVRIVEIPQADCCAC
nr:histidine phosphatase family protein [Clostridia bacterium]